MRFAMARGGQRLSSLRFRGLFPRRASRRFCLLAFSLACVLCIPPMQAQDRESLELGVLAQTTDNKVTAPYYGVSGPSSFALLGTNHRQLFAGPFAGYTWAFAPSLSIEGRAAYLPGKQPIQGLSGGSALLATGGLRATLRDHQLRFYARLAPGLVSFSGAGTNVDAAGWETSRVTHFAFDEGAGIALRLPGANVLQFDASRILYVEGGRSLGNSGDVTFSLTGAVEGHATLSLGLAHAFGGEIPNAPSPPTHAPPSTEVALSFALQRQPHLDFAGAQLSSDLGVAVSASHALVRWVGLDATVLVLPGGDSPNYQDGGAESEFLGGVRVGIERRRYAVFGKYRLGAVSFASTINENVVSPPLVRTWNYATDAGGIFEFCPRGGHVLLRFDAGEQYTGYHAVTVTEPAPEYSATARATYSNSPLLLIGAGWRFGRKAAR